MKQRDDWRLTEALHYEHGRADPFAAAVRATRMPMIITDPAKDDNPIVFCNEAFQRLSGYSREEVIGRNCRFLQGPETDPVAVQRIGEAVRKGEDIDIDILNYRKDGTSFWNALHMSPVRNDRGEIQFFFASQFDVTERIAEQEHLKVREMEMERQVESRTADLKAALEAKTLLLHEVDHRVKNNLTMIGSMLRLQARTINDPGVSAKLLAMLQRIDALATVHRQLYQSPDVTKFDIGGFAASLASDVIGSSGRTNITVKTDVELIFIHASRASALGLALNEILTNAIKHAYPDGAGGLLKLSAKQANGEARIDIIDEGPGLDGVESGGMGMMLIQRLSKQAGARINMRDHASGAHIMIEFPVET